MNERRSSVNLQWGHSNVRQEEGGPWAVRLLQIVDAGLVAVICGAPFIFGGRHDVGRLVFVALVAATAVAWFVRQSILPKAYWTRTTANVVFLLAVALVALQIAPLPSSWIAAISPRTAELLPLWTPGDGASMLGSWNTISFTPMKTTLGLATLLAYGLLFVVVSQRIGSVSDVRRALHWVAMAAVLMAVFGLMQFFTANGKFFWFYDHPYRTTDSVANGSFINRNHFASFLVLGIGPLVAWLVATLRKSAANTARYQSNGTSAYILNAGLFAGLVAIVLAVALSRSRGGAVAMLIAVATLSIIYWRWRLVDAKYLAGLAAVGLSVVGLLSIYGYDKVASRLDDLTDGSLEAIDRGAARREVWAANVAAIRAGGLIGSGVGSHLEISPLYLERASDKHCTHAENGYLQIATESGWFGVALLAGGIGLCGSWSIACWRNLRSPAEQMCFGAAAAGLTASLAHSAVDFVWYIPATMSVTLVLAACTLRLSQLALPEESGAAARPMLRRPRWLELTATAALAGAWAVYAYFAPAMASISWDRYLNTEVANSQLAHQISVAKVSGAAPIDISSRPILTDLMVRHLEETLRWNPQFALAHFELAQRSLDLFELRQQEAANAMGVSQVADAVAASRFKTPGELRSWLGRALGENAALLYRAHDHARKSVALCPLHGEAYVLLANSRFLDPAPRPSAGQLADQALRVRPRQSAVLFEMGRQRLLAGDLESAIRYWAQCSNSPGPHQLQIVQALAGPFMPATDYVQIFQPDWQTLREVWARYAQHGQPQDLARLASYAHQITEQQALEKTGVNPAYFWTFQARMYDELQRPQEALACLEKAYRAGPHIYSVRLAFGRALLASERFAEAEPHVRWCLARRPDHKALSAALVEITKQRFARRSSSEPQ